MSDYWGRWASESLGLLSHSRGVIYVTGGNVQILSINHHVIFIH